MNISIYFEAKLDFLRRSTLKLTGAARGLFRGGVFLADPEDAILRCYLAHPHKVAQYYQRPKHSPKCLIGFEGDVEVLEVFQSGFR